MPVVRRRRPWPVVSLALALLCLPAAARAERVDAMDTADHFYSLSDVAEVVEGDGTVTFAKTASGDATARWSLDAPGSVPLTPETERVEVDFAAFPDAGSVDVMLVVEDGNGKLKNVPWLKKHGAVGTAVLESVTELAKAAGGEDVRAYHLFFRIKRDPKGGVEIARIRLSAEGVAGAAETPDAGTPGAGKADAEAGKAEASVNFAESPDERGMTFDRGGAEPTALKRGGGTEPAWVVADAGHGGKQWQRTFNLDVTDPAITGRRSVDVEVTYNLDAWGSMKVIADTEGGPREVASLWGNAKGKWKTATVRIDDAAFDGGIDGKYDLRLAGDNGPLLLKRVRVVAYDPSHDVRWDRMLEVESATPVGSAAPPLFAFRRQSAAGLRYGIVNHADVSPPARYALRVLDADGGTVHQDAGPVGLGAGTTSLDLTFDTTGWALGPYTAEVAVYLDEQGSTSAGSASAGSEGPSFAFTTLFGVLSDADPAKARPGEFLFGLDPGGDAMTDAGLAYYRVMGVDLLRGMGDSRTTDAAAVKANDDRLAAEGVSAVLMVDPPGQMEAPSDAERAERLDAMVADLQPLARATAGRVTYYELGNEPDLPFFYPGTMAQYNAAFAAMSDAIHRGNPDALVMNGGLCFFGADGDRRAREFIGLVDPSKIDVWAYHGHGQGSEAERDAYDRQVEAVTAAGKAGIPYLDTETGVSAGGPTQYREQARTAVQKMTFAQSVDMPSLMFFRLFMGDAGYSLTADKVQPRPAVLAYRAMVERLRGARFARPLDTGEPDVEAYLFEHTGDAGVPTGGKTLVAWNNGTGRRTVSVDTAAPDAELVAYGLYGNPSPAAAGGGIATLSLDADPTYLVWTSSQPASSVAAATPALAPADVPALVAGGRTVTTWTARNDTDAPLDVTLAVDPVGRVPMTADPSTATATLAARSSRTLSVTVAAEGSAPLPAPRWWTVFTGLDPAAVAKMGPADFAEFLATLPGPSGPATPQRVWVEGDTIDLAALAGGYSEKAPAVLFASIDAPEATEVPFGAAADFWMRVYLNGEVVADTLEKGNGSDFTPAGHPFTLKLKKGRNVLAAQVLSGSAGFKFVFGGERELMTAAAGGVPPDRLDAALSAGGRVLAGQSVPVHFQPPLPAFAGLALGDPAARWLTREPVAALGAFAVVNTQEAYPDKSRWYGGPSDASAVAWLRDAGGAVEVVVAVYDDAAQPAADAGDAEALRQGDALRLTGPAFDVTVAPGKGGAVVRAADGSPSGVSATVEQPAQADGPRYVYRVSIPSSAVPDRLTLTVHDADDGVAKQTLTTPAVPIVRGR